MATITNLTLDIEVVTDADGNLVGKTISLNNLDEVRTPSATRTSSARWSR
jgi:hypothetical protein